jgi:hypothetical protein
MRSRVLFPALTWGVFLEGYDFQGDHGLGNLVELRFKAPPGTSYSYITIHLIGTTFLPLFDVPNSEVGYSSATTGRGDQEVHKEHVVGDMFFYIYILGFVVDSDCYITILMLSLKSC